MGSKFQMAKITGPRGVEIRKAMIHTMHTAIQCKYIANGNAIVARMMLFLQMSGVWGARIDSRYEESGTIQSPRKAERKRGDECSQD